MLGVATGNGLEHVDPAVTHRVVGVDVNASFLERARRRYELLGPRLELHCADAARVDLEPGAFDLVRARLSARAARPRDPRPVCAASAAPGRASILQLGAVIHGS